MRIKIHPLFFVLALALVAFGQAQAFVCTLSALVFHELAHALMAKERGFVVKQLVILPFGAMMSVDERFDRISSVLIGLAGPVANLVLGLITLGLWWLFPSVYPITKPFLYANLSIGLFNLLPIYPLDGARVALGFSKNKLRALKAMKIGGTAVSLLLMAAFIASVFFKINFTLGIMAVFLFYGATFGTKEETYMSVLDSSSKNYELGVIERSVKISDKTPLVRFYHHINSTSDTSFSVLDEGNKEIKRLTENDLKEYAVKYPLSTPIGEAISGKVVKRSRTNLKELSSKNPFKRRFHRQK